MPVRRGTISGYCVAVCALAISLLLVSGRGHAQVAGATLSGTVTDGSGASIPKAQVSIKNISTGVVRSTTTDSAGVYSLPNLLPGDYDLTATATGFKTTVRTGVTLTVGAQTELNVSLKIGAVQQQVVVTGNVQTVELASSSTGGLLQESTVENLPLNGRDWTTLALLQPGVVTAGAAQADIANGNQRGNRGFGTQLPIEGLDSAMNAYRIDGVNINGYVGQGPGSVGGETLGVDAIQEFSVLTGNYSAAYGHTSGGVINATLRSGTNAVHGNAFEYLRNSALDARNYFDGAQIPPFRRNQFGGSLGGPIRKNNTFYYADYEGLRQSLSSSNQITVFAPSAAKGILNFPGGPSTYPSGCVPTATPNQCQIQVDASVQPFLGLWHAPNAGLLGTGNTGIYAFTARQLLTDNFVSGRVDHTFSPKDTVFGDYQIDRSDLTLPDSTNTVLNGENTRRQLVAFEETHTFTPMLVNSVRVGYNRSSALTVGSISPLSQLAAAGSLQSVPDPAVGPPIISVSGVQGFPGGMNSGTHAEFVLDSYQAYDDVFLTKGKHNLEFGVSIERAESNTAQVSRRGGQFTFGSIAAFLTNQPHSYQAAFPGDVYPENLRQAIFGTYIQDNWHILRNLTINLGVRYEMATVPMAVNGKMANVRNIFTDTTASLGNPLFKNPTYLDFAPRVGFAWDPFGTGKTSIRGGFGVFDTLPYQSELFADGTTSMAPFFKSGSISNLPQGAFPTKAFQTLVGSPAALRELHVDFNPPASYVLQWNLTIERALNASTTVSVGYAANHGVNMTDAAGDSDMVLPTKSPAGYLWPVSGGTPVNPHFGRIDYIGWGSSSVYNALQAYITKQMSHGVQGQIAYTWSRAIDSHSAARGDDAYLGDVSSPLFFDQHVMRGPSDFNITHDLESYITWNLPGPGSLHGPAGVLGRGWQLGTVDALHTGSPFTVLVGGDPMGQDFGDPFAYPELVPGPGCGSPISPGNINYLRLNCFSPRTAPASMAAQCVPASFPGAVAPPPSGQIYCQNLLGTLVRNNVIGPGLVGVDLSLFKNNYIPRISEHFNAQFRLEVFNVLNHTNFNAPWDNQTLFDQTGAPIDGAGRIDSTSTSAREIQLAVRLIW